MSRLSDLIGSAEHAGAQPAGHARPRPRLPRHRADGSVRNGLQRVVELGFSGARQRTRAGAPSGSGATGTSQSTSLTGPSMILLTGTAADIAHARADIGAGGRQAGADPLRNQGHRARRPMTPEGPRPRLGFQQRQRVHRRAGADRLQHDRDDQPGELPRPNPQSRHVRPLPALRPRQRHPRTPRSPAGAASSCPTPTSPPSTDTRRRSSPATRSTMSRSITDFHHRPESSPPVQRERRRHACASPARSTPTAMSR